MHVEGTKVGKVNEDECDKIVEMIQDLIAKLDGYEDECNKFVEMIIFHMALASSLWWEANRVDLFEANSRIQDSRSHCKIGYGYEDECDKIVEMIIFHMALVSSLWWEANRVDLFEANSRMQLGHKNTRNMMS